MKNFEVNISRKGRDSMGIKGKAFSPKDRRMSGGKSEFMAFGFPPLNREHRREAEKRARRAAKQDRKGK